MAIVELPQVAEPPSVALPLTAGSRVADADPRSTPAGGRRGRHPRRPDVGVRPAALKTGTAERGAGRPTDDKTSGPSVDGVPLEIGVSLLRQRDGAALTQRLLVAAAELTGAAHAAVVVYTADGRVAHQVQHPAGGAYDADRSRLPPAVALDTVPTRAAQVGPTSRHSPVPAQPRRFLRAPFVGPSGLASVLYAGDKHRGRFSAADQRRLTALAALAEVASDWQGQVAREQSRAAAVAEPGASIAPEHERQPILRQVIDAQEAERARVARDLHDEVGQALTSVLLGLHLVDTALTSDPVDTERAAARAAEVRVLVADALRGVRRMAFDLRPTVLDDLGLLAAVERLGDDLHERHGLRVEVQVEGLTAEDRLPGPVETVVYRVVQESLTNVVRHAHASTVRVVLQGDQHRVRALVRDDGVGFDVSAATLTLGLRGMTERAELAGGAVRLRSSPGRGCTVELEVPLG